MITALGYPKLGLRTDLRNTQFGLIEQALAVLRQTLAPFKQRDRILKRQIARI